MFNLKATLHKKDDTQQRTKVDFIGIVSRRFGVV